MIISLERGKHLHEIQEVLQLTKILRVKGWLASSWDREYDSSRWPLGQVGDRGYRGKASFGRYSSLAGHHGLRFLHSEDMKILSSVSHNGLSPFH